MTRAVHGLGPAGAQFLGLDRALPELTWPASDARKAGDLLVHAVGRACIADSGSGWSAEETIPLPHGDMDSRGAVLSPDGQRIDALYSRYPDGLWLVAGGVSGWASVQLGSPAPFSGRVSLTGDGGIMVSVPHGSGPTVHPNASISSSTREQPRCSSVRLPEGMTEREPTPGFEPGTY
jgi:hypothetical protein